MKPFVMLISVAKGFVIILYLFLFFFRKGSDVLLEELRVSDF